ncbi:MAG: S41 family peptidase [Phycisphaerae bacterium]
MPRRNFIWLLIVAATAAVSVLIARMPRRTTGNSAGELATVDAAWELIRENYYGRLDPSRARKSAVRGIVEQLDEYSSYVPASQVETFDHRVMGRHRGTGLRFRKQGDFVQTLWPYFGSPAHRRRVEPGMDILYVGQQDVAGMDAEQVRELLDGQVGTEVRVVLQKSGSGPRVVTLTRREFPLETVTGYWRTEGQHWATTIDPQKRICYLRVKEFARGTCEQLRRELWRLSAPAGLVLDLRGNPGGLLEEAIQTANVFLREGTVVTVAQKRGPRRTHVARDHGTWLNVPVVVLTDSRTASAAEIVAGALGFHTRAVLLGERTRGKGCIQSMFPLPGDLGQINLTTGEFLIGPGIPVSPRGDGTRGGVQPHVKVLTVGSDDPTLSELREQGAALWREIPRATTQTTTGPGPSPRERFARKLLENDPPLRRAVQLLGDPTQHAVEIRQARQRARAQREALEADPNAPGRPEQKPHD